MRELNAKEIEAVSGGFGAFGATIGAFAGGTHYVVSNTLSGGRMSLGGLAGSAAAGALTGSGFGVIARGAGLAVKGIQFARGGKVTSNTIKASMTGGAVTGSVDGLTSLTVNGVRNRFRRR